MKERLKFFLFTMVVVFGIPSLVIGVISFYSNTPVVDSFKITFLFAGLGWIIYSPYWEENRERKHFEGQVTGYIAALVVSGVLWDSSGQKVVSIARRELKRVYSIKRRSPEMGSDPFWYATSNCAEFALLCIKKYAEESGDVSDARASELLHYCEECDNNAHRLEAYYYSWHFASRWR